MSALVCADPARHGWSGGVCKVNLDELEALTERRGRKRTTTRPIGVSACWKLFAM